MELLCVGLSHKTAPVSVRERLALSTERQAELLQTLARVGDAMLVSTCNRVELYVAPSDTVSAREAVLGVLSTYGGADALSHLYEHRADAALVHLFRVASSLDSMVLGEAQILGQVKEAFELAQKVGSVKGDLGRACQAAFAAAKRVRTETSIGRAATSMASAAVEMAAKIFGDLRGHTVLVVGAGEMSELAGRHLTAAGASRVLVTNRTFDRAQALAAEFNGQARRFEELPQLLVEADVVVTSTASPTPIFTKAMVAASLKARRHRPLFMVDLAVPRDIAADVNKLPDVYAYDVDDLQQVISENSAARAAEAARAEVLIAEEVVRFARDRAVREQTPVLQQLRAHAEQIARTEVEKTLSALGPSLTEKQKRSVEAMGRAIVNKLLHEPTSRLRAVSDDEAANQRLSGAAAELFGFTAQEKADEAPAEEVEPVPAVATLASAGSKR